METPCHDIKRLKQGKENSKKETAERQGIDQKKNFNKLARYRISEVNYFVYDLFHFPKKSVGILSIPAFFILC